MFQVIDKVNFPRSKDREVNMLPFRLGDWSSLPEEYHDYIPVIKKCNAQFKDEVCYLTISESYVEGGKSQRRPGAHTEATQKGRWGGGWGGSVFMASNISNTCRVWNQTISKSELGKGGSLEDQDLGEDYHLMKKGELVSMCDRTPHEALIQKESGYRQFFRLVGPDIFGWYAEHSTKNPLCDIPKNIPVITYDKFREEGL